MTKVKEKRSYGTSSKTGFLMTQKSETFYHPVTRASGLRIVFKWAPYVSNKLSILCTSCYAFRALESLIYNNHSTKCTQLVIDTFISILQWNSYMLKSLTGLLSESTLVSFEVVYTICWTVQSHLFYTVFPSSWWTPWWWNCGVRNL
jgi:hypothetical protein